uniref:Uncharacterized protein n=1 Tax=Arundo donax TaxID=35708 RepID=A0A0A9H2E1_ARUDO
MGHEWSNYQKVECLKETIRSTEAAKLDALKEYEDIKENNMIEIKRFDKERRRDFVEMLKGVAINQVTYADHFADMWAKVAEDTKVYANRGN